MDDLQPVQFPFAMNEHEIAAYYACGLRIHKAIAEMQAELAAIKAEVGPLLDDLCNLLSDRAEWMECREAAAVRSARAWAARLRKPVD